MHFKLSCAEKNCADWDKPSRAFQAQNCKPQFPEKLVSACSVSIPIGCTFFQRQINLSFALFFLQDFKLVNAHCAACVFFFANGMQWTSKSHLFPRLPKILTTATTGHLTIHFLSITDPISAHLGSFPFQVVRATFTIDLFLVHKSMWMHHAKIRLGTHLLSSGNRILRRSARKRDKYLSQYQIKFSLVKKLPTFNQVLVLLAFNVVLHFPFWWVHISVNGLHSLQHTSWIPIVQFSTGMAQLENLPFCVWLTHWKEKTTKLHGTFDHLKRNIDHIQNRKSTTGTIRGENPVPIVQIRARHTAR